MDTGPCTAFDGDVFLLDLAGKCDASKSKKWTLRSNTAFTGDRGASHDPPRAEGARRRAVGRLFVQGATARHSLPTFGVTLALSGSLDCVLTTALYEQTMFPGFEKKLTACSDSTDFYLLSSHTKNRGKVFGEGFKNIDPPARYCDPAVTREATGRQ